MAGSGIRMTPTIASETRENRGFRLYNVTLTARSDGWRRAYRTATRPSRSVDERLDVLRDVVVHPTFVTGLSCEPVEFACDEAPVLDGFLLPVGD